MAAAGRGVWRDVVRSFGGDREAAKAAVEELAETPEVMEAWATRCIRREPGHDADPAFAWEDLPTNLRPVAARGMAMAYLAATRADEGVA